MAKVVIRLRDRGIEPWVVSVGGPGPIGDQLKAAGVRVDSLGVRGAFGILDGRRRLRRILVEARANLVQGWMYHGNLLAALAAVPGVPVLFGIRHSLPTLAHERFQTRLVIRLGARLSGRASAIVYNTKASISQHEKLGYAASHSVWIPNGFDTLRFRPDREARREQRDRLGFDDAEQVVGLVARYHPIKNQHGFLRAAALVAARCQRARFLMVGHGIDSDASRLRAQAANLGISERVTLLGDRADMPALMNALDVLCMSSLSEGFPNTVAEAMACGIPVVATRVGDVPFILGGSGVEVAPGDVDALASGLMTVLSYSPEDWSRASARSRTRIVENFSEPVTVDAFESLYRRLGLPAGMH